MFEPTEQELVERISFQERVERAIKLIKDNQPENGYYLAFSGGKDSITARKLLDLACATYEAVYHVTTIDPPEQIYFLRKYYPDTKWDFPEHGNMMHRVATSIHTPPTRNGRWCCEEYKERGGKGKVKVFGVRKAESKARAARWNEIAYDQFGDKCICPIALWSDEQVWEFIRHYNMPYISLYDEGWSRIGCVGCPLTSAENQEREFKKWPRFEQNWRRAIIKHWELYHDRTSPRTGKKRFEHKFKSGEDLYQWWRTARLPDYIRGNCQSELMWTNEPGMYDEEEV